MRDTYTNQSYLELPDEDIDRQDAMLEPLRQLHRNELLSTGAAGRIAVSHTMGNFSAPIIDVLPDMIAVHPYRNRIWTRPSRLTQILYYDLGLYDAHDPQATAKKEAFDQLTTDPARDNYLLYLRFTRDIDDMQTDSWSKHAGIALDAKSAHNLGMERLLPCKGVQKEDLLLIERQLAEVESFALRNRLTIVDQTTLQCGPGEYLFR